MITFALRSLAPAWAIAIILLSLGTHALAKPPAPKQAKRRPASTAAPAKPIKERITIARAINKALANNRGFMRSKIDFRNQELSYDNAWDGFFLPKIDASMSVSNSYTVGQFAYADSTEISRSKFNRGYPAASVSLNFGRYTLFNFWRDWLTYETARLSWNRAREQFTETERALRFKTLTDVYGYKILVEKLDAANRSVTVAEAIVGYMKSGLRSGVGKTSESEYQSAISDLMNAKNQRDQQESYVKGALWALNQQLGDPLGQEYDIQVDLKYRPVKLTPDAAYAIYLETGPNVKTNRLSLRTAELSVESAEKARLPLPTITFSGITVSYSNSYYAGRGSTTTTDSGANLDVGASINLTIPLLGPGGLFNGRSVEAARLSRDSAEIGYIDSLNNDRVGIHANIQNIEQQEQAILNNKQRFDSAQAVLDSLYSKLNTANISRLELRDAISQVRDAEFALLDAQVNHLRAKVDLASLLGVDNLPGDTFE